MARNTGDYILVGGVAFFALVLLVALWYSMRTFEYSNGTYDDVADVSGCNGNANCVDYLTFRSRRNTAWSIIGGMLVLLAGGGSMMFLR